MTKSRSGTHVSSPGRSAPSGRSSARLNPTLATLLPCSALLAFGLASCNDLSTGHLEEPEGPLQITKLTLQDASSRDATVFTDMSLPNCKDAPDCTTDANKDTFICRVCYTNVFKDRYAPHNSPPTPDSGQDMRVVFNKAPMLLNGADIDPTPDKGLPADSTAVVLRKCSTAGACTEVKANVARYLIVTGADITFDPTTIPYGPALQLKVVGDPRAALEPDTTYQIGIDPGVSGRDGNKVDLSTGAKLLSFKTEPLKVLSAGKGAANDPYVYASTTMLGTSASPYKIADLPLDGVVVLKLNAPIHPAALKTATVKALINGGPATVAVKLATNALVPGKATCDSHRLLYIYPDTMNGTWQEGAMPVVTDLTITIPMGVIGDVSQDALSQPGTHKLASDVVLSVKLTGKPAPMGYAGTLVSAAKQAEPECKTN